MSISNNKSHPYHELAKPDGDNATDLKPKDVGESEFWKADFLYLNKQKYYQHLKDLNAGKKNGPTWYNDPYITYESARDLIDSVSAELDLSPLQRHKARRYFTNLDRGPLGQKLELIAYCLCQLLVEQDERTTERRCHPNVPDEQQDELFKRVANLLDLDQRAINKMYGKLQSQIPKHVPPVAHDKRDPDHYPGGGI